jgi:hypothetical protein
MSIRAYARHRGITHPAVRKALARGRITPLRREGNCILIDSEAADRQWQQWQERVQRRAEADHQHRTEASRAFSSARAIREHYRAKLARLEHDEKTGKLVDKDAVHVAAFNTARTARDVLLGIADRVAPQVPGRSLEDVRRLLRNEVEHVAAVIAAPME